MGKAGSFLYSSKDESDIWWPKPPVCPRRALETLFITGRLWSRGDGLTLKVLPPFIPNALICLSMALASLLCALWGEARERGGSERSLQK